LSFYCLNNILFSRGIAVGCLGGPLYAVGGLDDSTCFDTVERYDIEHNTWSTVASMSTARGGVAVAALKVKQKLNL
jgi:kelch-like protein 8